MGSKHVAMRDRKFLLQSGLYVGCVSLVSGLSIIQAPKHTNHFQQHMEIMGSGFAGRGEGGNLC